MDNIESIFRKGWKYGKRILGAGLISMVIYGCDECCTVPIPEPEPKPELSENTQILSGSELSQIQSVGEDQITFFEPISYLSPGDIVVGEISDITPNGLLRKINSISSDGKIIYVQQASLEEAVKNGEFEFNGTFIPANATMFNIKEARTKSIDDLAFNISFNDVVLYDDDESNDTDYDRIIGNADIDFEVDFYLKLKIKNFRLENFIFTNTITEDAKFGVKSSSDLTMSIDHTVNIAEFPIPAVVIGYIPTIPPFPIIVDPQLELLMKIKSDFAKLDKQVMQTFKLKSGLFYEREFGWDIIKERFSSFDCFPQGFQETFDFKIAVGPRLSFLFYGLAGPYGEIDAYLNWDRSPSEWELSAGIEGIIGAEMKILGRTLVDYSTTIWDYKYVIDEGEREIPEPTITIIQPGPEGKDAYVREGEYYETNSSFAERDGFTYKLVLDNYSKSDGNIFGESFIEFPLSSIPTNTNIASAKLKLFGTQNSYFSGVPINLKKIVEPWEEYEYEYELDYEPSIISSSILTGESQWYEWDVTDLVQKWISGGFNHGIAITSGNRTKGDFFTSPYYFYSGDYLIDSLKRPKLIVSYY